MFLSALGFKIYLGIFEEILKILLFICSYFSRESVIAQHAQHEKQTFFNEPPHVFENVAVCTSSVIFKVLV